jgi:hypothetical protein
MRFLMLLLIAAPAAAVPVVPNFQQGVLSSTTTTSKWTSVDAATKPTWTIVNQGEAFQFVETLQGPGLVNHTLINRDTDIESITETTSTFTQ